MMGMQGGESFTGQSSRWKKNTTSNGRKSSDYCKRAKRVLEPVLEHAELVICSNNIKKLGAPGAPGRETMKSSSSCSFTGNGCQSSTVVQQTYNCNIDNRRKAGGGGMRILSKLRDGYVKLMNDVAMGADLAGVSSFYGAPPAGYGCCPVAAVDHSSPVLSTSPHLSPRSPLCKPL